MSEEVRMRYTGPGMRLWPIGELETGREFDAPGEWVEFLLGLGDFERVEQDPPKIKKSESEPASEDEVGGPAETEKDTEV